jgi:hypothetical protein
MADTKEHTENRRHTSEHTAAPPLARVRDDDLEPHEGLRYIAKLFKALALLLVFMLIAEVIIGLRQDGMAALGTIMVEATRLIVFAGFLWGVGDLAVLLIESNHDLRASRILLGRLNGRMERAFSDDTPPPASGEEPTTHQRGFGVAPPRTGT